MGDTTNLMISVKGAPKHVRDAIRKERFGSYTREGTEDAATGELTLGFNDVSVGTSSTIASWFDSLIANGVSDVDCHACEGSGERNDAECLACAGEGVVSHPPQDFAYYVYEDPKYEWLGTVDIHVPGLSPDFEGECDSQGEPVVNNEKVVAWVDEATDLEKLKAKVRAASGFKHVEAWNSFTGTP